MKKKLPVLALAALFAACSTTNKIEGVPAVADHNVKYDNYFTANTMRYDFHHAGDSKNEYYYFDKLIREGEWAGSRTSLINPFDYGEQHFRIIDAASGNIIYKNN